MLLFYGSQHTKMTAGIYTSTLVFLGIVSGVHIFCFLIIYQFRKNLIEERNIRRRGRHVGVEATLGTRFEPTAPAFSSGKYIPKVLKI